MKKSFIFIGLILVLSVSAFAQTKKKTSPKTKKTSAGKTVSAKTETVETAPIVVPPKKNERPEGEQTNQQPESKKNRRADKDAGKSKPEKIVYPYVYEFSQPNFMVSRMLIEHDEKGKGTITFEKSAVTSDPIVDPIQLSQVTLGKLNELFFKP